ncbi:MAG: hypothetical protein VYD30_05910 [Chloroflexota bacterium]|nr:hypothetical protein [Chloroflexota bacterium]
MALPKIDTPMYSCKLPSDNKQTVTYRPFLVKEEKILLTAMEGAKDLKGEEFQRVVRDTILNIITNCTDGKVDGNKLPAFDVDFLFLNIRAKSRGELIEPSFTCNQEGKDGNLCGNIDKYPIRIDEIKIDFPDKDYSKIMIKDDIGIQLKFLSTEEVKVHDGEVDPIEKMFKIIVDSIDYVFDAENVYKGKETAKPELVKFVESLSESTFDEIKEFFGNLPTLRHKVDYRCTKCGHKEPVTLEGLEDFFGFA